MSVNTWNRSDSKMIFLSKTHQLGVEITRYVNSLPTKYRSGFGDELERCIIKALQSGKLANSIFASGTKGELHERRYHFLDMRAYIDTIAEIVNILNDSHVVSDSLPPAKVEKLYKREQKIGNICNTIIKCIDGLIISDINRWNKHHPYNKIGTKWRMKSVIGDVRFASNAKYAQFLSNEEYVAENPGDDEFAYGALPEMIESNKDAVQSTNSAVDNLPSYDEIQHL